MGEVVELDCVTTLDIPAEKILTKAIEANLDTAIVVGFNQDGSLYFSSTTGDAGTCMFLFELAKRSLVDVVYELSGTKGD